MNPFNRGAPITRVPPGYQPNLDRLPAQPASGCRGFLITISLLAVVLCGGGFLIVNHINALNAPAVTPTPQPTFTPTDEPTIAPATATPTLDPWSLTGTALINQTASPTFTPTPTMDYCWYLTPTPTPSPTLSYTPDEWALKGTEVFYLTSTPTPRLDPTRAPPRSWCDYTPEATPTRFEILSAIETQAAKPTFTVTPTGTPRYAFPTVDTSGPSGAGSGGSGSVPGLPPTAAPPVIVVPTLPLPTIAKTKRPTRTPTATITESPTPTETHTATYTPTVTETPTDTPTLTITPSETITETPTPTLTPTASHTASITPTNTPTATHTPSPIITIFSSSCAAGYPEWGIQNIGYMPGNIVLFDIKLGDLLANVGYWETELVPFGVVTASAPAWAGVPGVYILNIYQTWDPFVPVQSAAATCTGPIGTLPTATNTATLSPEVTAEITPTITPTIEVTP